MSAAQRQVGVGSVGRAHGVDGSFWIEGATHALPVGTEVTVAGRTVRIERRAGTDERPLVRLHGVEHRDAAAALRGEPLLVPLEDAPLEPGEWLTEDLVGCRVDGVGEVRRVISGPSCDVLEVGEDALLIPFISDAVRSVDPERRVIEIDRGFLALP